MEILLDGGSGRELQLIRHDSSWRSSRFTRELSPKELQILIVKDYYISEES